ncbi:MAG: hypothetical protein JW894_10050 [Bacteroidales bacterium]|nr:hypothetical protein [Bacteroidales bacterium]
MHGQRHNGHGSHSSGCPEAREMSFNPLSGENLSVGKNQPSTLRKWPVQLHLINPVAGYFQKSDLLVAADCTAFVLGNFHSEYLNGKSLVIACPKLDSNIEVYLAKFTALIDQALVNTISVMIMEVPCCGGLLAMVCQAVENAHRKVPIKATVVSIQGEILREEWV